MYDFFGQFKCEMENFCYQTYFLCVFVYPLSGIAEMFHDVIVHCCTECSTEAMTNA